MIKKFKGRAWGHEPEIPQLGRLIPENCEFETQRIPGQPALQRKTYLKTTATTQSAKKRMKNWESLLLTE